MRSFMGESLIIRAGGGVDTSNATAKNNQLVQGYTCYVNDELVVGNIPIKSPVNKKINVSQSTSLESGYYVGSDVISTSSLSEETVASAAVPDILIDNNGWVNGAYLIGTMVNRGAVAQSLAANGSYTIPAGWHNGSGKITQALSTQAAVNITPGTANKTACAASKWTTGNIWVVGNANLVAGNIKNGVNIFGKVGTYTGWVDNELNLGGITTTAWEYNDPGSSDSDPSYWNHLYKSGTFTSKGWTYLKINNTRWDQYWWTGEGDPHWADYARTGSVYVKTVNAGWGYRVSSWGLDAGQWLTKEQWTTQNGYWKSIEAITKTAKNLKYALSGISSPATLYGVDLNFGSGSTNVMTFTLSFSKT